MDREKNNNMDREKNNHIETRNKNIEDDKNAFIDQVKDRNMYIDQVKDRNTYIDQFKDSNMYIDQVKDRNLYIDHVEDRDRDSNKDNDQNMNDWKHLLERNRKETTNSDQIEATKEENNGKNKQKTANPIKSTKSTSSMCRGLYNPPAYTKLVTICRDCFNLFKEPEVYTMCMEGCFDTPHFFHCAKMLLVEKEKVETLVNLVGKK
eukprot:GFUD01120582.1.p1 GENE.GFUD01120582.1~~GFUD01120582.1.p1  ORF type:complete len:215 (-),score=77.09 GFUD01120582.1:108-725(-)